MKKLYINNLNDETKGYIRKISNCDLNTKIKHTRIKHFIKLMKYRSRAEPCWFNYHHKKKLAVKTQ